MEAVGRLAGGVAHDFNNLLTVIHGFTRMVFDRLPPDDDGRELLAEVMKSAERAANLTRQLLAFSRKQLLRPRVVDVNALLVDLWKLLQRLIGEDVELVLSADEALGSIEVDPSQFEQAIINLAVNARDAMPNGGRLMIRAHECRIDETQSEAIADVSPGHYVCVAVADSGLGMDDATKAQIFEPFFTTKAPGQGTGLGLAMVYGFVKQSGGHVEVFSTPGRGTTFNVFLPVATPRRTDAAGGERPREGTPAGTETVLVVEDETSVRAFVRAVLESSGYTVLDARSGEEALARAAAHPGPLDLVLTDVVMPQLGGRQLADLLKGSRPGIRVLFMSGYTNQPLPAAEGASGVVFLQKPFGALELVQKIRDVLDAPP
jgi:CheY-like chemotaxis protein